ncbi:MAG: BrnT family toxin [Chloroflexota bacterium]
MTLRFEWDEEKADMNFKKHHIRFEEAKSVFGDPFAITIDDPDHSENEERFVDIGTSASGRILTIIYTEREGRIRLISCRKATPNEQRQYEQQII